MFERPGPSPRDGLLHPDTFVEVVVAGFWYREVVVLEQGEGDGVGLRPGLRVDDSQLLVRTTGLEKEDRVDILFRGFYFGVSVSVT